MAQQTSQIRKLMDPFSISAQMNNVGVLIIAYVTTIMNQKTKCQDNHYQNYLSFILYGSTLTCGGTFVLTILYLCGMIDYCINKVMPCSQVCLTLNTLGVFFIGVLYHLIATVYGLYFIFFGGESQCTELQMFKRITCTIYAIWFFGIILFVIFICYRDKLKSNRNQLNTHLMNQI